MTRGAGSASRPERRDGAAEAFGPARFAQVGTGRDNHAAVVVGASGACGLGVVRSLGRAGVPVTIIDPDAAAPAMHSRFACNSIVGAASGPALVQQLLALRPTFANPPVLFPTSDEAALTISEHRAALDGLYRFRLPTPERLRDLMHKTRFQELAQEHGFPVPRAATVASAADLSGLATLRYPCVVKPDVKTDAYFHAGFARGYKVPSPCEAEAICRRVLEVIPEVIVQEWIEGGPENLYFCLQYRSDKEAVASFTGRKLAIWPPDVGVTASCTSAPDAHPTLHAMTDAFFSTVSCMGMCSMEYKRDSRTGEFSMVEPTVGRVDWQEEVAAIHGVDVPLAAYRFETEASPALAPVAVEPTAIWRDPFMQLKASRGSARPEAVPRLPIYDAYWRRDDPIPALMHARGAVARAVRQLFNSVR